MNDRKNYMRVCARIDLDAIERNMERMHAALRPGVRMLAVLKTDGYGHGAAPIVKLLEDKDYVWGYAAASLEEALLLRGAGAQRPVLVLGCVFEEQFADAIREKIRINVYCEETARTLSDLAVRMGTTAYVHIKLDTGMSRLGFSADAAGADAIARVAALPGLRLEGLFTHFAKADETDKQFTKVQIDRYLRMKDALKERGVTFSICHMSNSAGIIDFPDLEQDVVRAGISLYGLYPSEEVKKEAICLSPALELISHVTYVKWIEAGTPVSYGGTYVAERRMRVATVPVGYGDGYPRSLSNKGYVLIRGQKAPILGRVCMDQFMVDVTGIEGASYRDRVVLIGRDGDAYLPVEALSELSGRFNYELVCCLSKRIPREYVRHGEVVAQIDHFA